MGMMEGDQRLPQRLNGPQRPRYSCKTSVGKKIYNQRRPHLKKRQRYNGRICPFFNLSEDTHS